MFWFVGGLRFFTITGRTSWELSKMKSMKSMAFVAQKILYNLYLDRKLKQQYQEKFAIQSYVYF